MLNLNFDHVCIQPWYSNKAGSYLPCGKCGECLKRKISDLSLRCQVELRNSDCAYFVTLTYEKDPLQLYKKDLQDFFRRLRKLGFKFSYLALGDYGDTFGRPHYHVLFFVKGPFQTELIYPCWVGGGSKVRRRGFTHCQAVTMGRISYTVRYGFLAKLDWDKQSDQRQAPFFLSSRRPALGSSYLDDLEVRKKLLSSSCNRYFALGKSKRPLPRYYHLKLFGPGSTAVSQLKATERMQELERKVSEKIQRYRDRGFNDSERVYVETAVNTSNVFLEGLRLQKKMKNKLL